MNPLDYEITFRAHEDEPEEFDDSPEGRLDFDGTHGPDLDVLLAVS